jgi:predicted dehydrogenase
MSEESLRVGIIGVGAFAMMYHVPLLHSTGRAKITAVCRRSEDKLAMAKDHIGAEEAYTDWREMLDKAELDAVVVCTPHDLHAAPTIAALERGLHVLVEKPMALKSEDAWAMVDAAKQADRVLMVAYPGVLNARMRAVKKALEAGRIGDVRQIVTAATGYYRYWYEGEIVPENAQKIVRESCSLPDEFFNNWVIDADYWRSDPAQNGGGVFVDGGTHAVNVYLWLGGAPPVEVVAFSESIGLPVESFISVQARLANGVLLSVVSADTSPQQNTDWQVWMIIGEDGVMRRDREGNTWIETAETREKLEPEGPDLYDTIAFVNCVLDGSPNPVPGEQGAYAVAFIEAAYQSAAEGRIVTVPLPSYHHLPGSYGERSFR